MSTPTISRWAALFVLALAAIARSPTPVQATPSANTQPTTAPGSLLAAATAGDAKAQFTLAESYFDDRYATLGYAQAVAWYRKSAAQGYAPAQDRIGSMCEDNTGLPSDYKKAVNYFRLAANQG